MEFSKEVEAENRKRVIRIVEEGAKSEYWKIISGEVEKLIKRNEMFLDSFKTRAFKTEQDMKDHTNTVIATNSLKWMLRLNEQIIEDNLSFFKKLERFAERTLERANSFVKR